MNWFHNCACLYNFVLLEIHCLDIGTHIFHARPILLLAVTAVILFAQLKHV